MKGRIASIVMLVAFVVIPSACTSQSVRFHVEDGICYRTRTINRAGCQTSEVTTNAAPRNCNLPEN